MPKNPSSASIECRFCACRQNKVINTWQNQIKIHGKVRTIVRRRRVCRNCGLGFTTIETYEDETIPNVPDVGVAPAKDVKPVTEQDHQIAAREILPPKKKPPPRNPYLDG